MATLNRKKIGLALGGGGAKGLAHIGVIKTLEQAGIPIDYISGTSMGALVGCWYSVTKNIVFLENLFLKMSGSFKTEDGVKNNLGDGLFKDDKISKFLHFEFGKKTFDDCQIPFCAVATDAETGLEVDLDKGDLVPAVEASVAIPLVFKPVKLGKQLLMDGGVSNPVPADVVRRMGAEYVIAIDVSSRWVSFFDHYGTKNSTEMIIRDAFSALEYQIAQKTTREADLILRPKIDDYTSMDFNQAGSIIDTGIKEAKNNLARIRRGTGYRQQRPKTLGEIFQDFKELINSN